MPHNIPFPKPPIPLIDTQTYRLPQAQYVAQSVQKSGIVLHHTVSSSVDSVYNWWLDKGKDKPVRVGTAYVIGKSGRIYQFFPDDNWAWHLGKNVSNDTEARTIGIEIVSEGGLIPVGGQLKKFFNPKTGRGFDVTEPHVDLGKVWRGFRYFDAYSREQVLSTICLVDYLCDKYDIPRVMYENLWDYNPEIKDLKGIMTHAQIRPDKTDVHPHFPVLDLAKWTKLTLV